ncbi:zinc-dependent metalloprotease [Crocinitomix algicola]|uniref:zinc-dependent metalloprotease n=1 Tax=Crocinitomix algicola TaxID=1740263 RepID=UPI0008725DEF|nr:zinc-dependent metalloprotease [Crocinitomix algicola]
MNLKSKLLILILLLLSVMSLNAQTGLVSQVRESVELSTEYPQCGSYELMKNWNTPANNYLDLSNRLLEDVTRIIEVQKSNRSFDDLFIIPVVFHVVYNEEDENIPDSVIFNQLQVLNECFRRGNEDAADTRAEFLELVGDTKIEFVMADIDPSGDPTIGITRTSTEITHFGGILPYGPGETEEISEWVNDSLYYNLFRLTRSDLGGNDAWDTDAYLNIWMGDLRIFEPEFDDFEEIVFFALATPPLDHENWPAELVEELADFEQGVLIHYVNVGSNNPNNLPAPYAGYNAATKSGKILVHEVGHYLGLRHIWGDGACPMDDYISDTPKSNASSAWACNHFLNSCTDDIGGLDLPNMVENYMDYSNGNCQNSFTLGQADVMRNVLEIHRPFLAETISTVGVSESSSFASVQIYPNPSPGEFYLEFGGYNGIVDISIYNLVGQKILGGEYETSTSISFDLSVKPGVYFVDLNFENGLNEVVKIVVE